MLRIFLVMLFGLLIHGKNDSLLWNENYKLSWKDFKAHPRLEVDAVALTVSGISFSYSLSQNDNEDYRYQTFVEAHFYPEKSWYKAEVSNNHILKHEQLHFDLTELYARKLRKRIAETTFTKQIRSELNQLNDDINEELKITQDKYDFETNHSINIEVQKEWEDYITKELKKLRAFRLISYE
ncbi:DUF922 domain-containing protein [Yeosuana sp. MJ-SS3]|uniref:DUF922 domain-containing protein n=1 Tax=Gilvirhabdus luticola TaxID=3079858 RepID=A0ABU3U547_9FLAO|nr:DUF922 domain-containing protein [Yeosuana sp. MJ-SS3]MDU8885528.1 DUF922 domain-containing protein [Yeosuana sp. MJ-SS3]